MQHHSRQLFGWFILACGGCLPGTYEGTRLDNPVNSALSDDAAPPEATFDPALSYKSQYGSGNNSDKRFRFDVSPYMDDAERAEAERLYPSHNAFLRGHSGSRIPSVQTIGTYLKQIDDTIYAGVEQVVQDGLAPTVKPKREVLEGAAQYLSARRSAAGDEALVALLSALRLGGQEPAIAADLADKVNQVVASFEANASESKPIGFYTWSEALRRIWKQDRLLQAGFSSAETSCALAAAIAADAERRKEYETLVSLYGKLTNPVKASLVGLLDIASTPECLTHPPAAFLSKSRTAENELFEKLYPNGVPERADLMADVIAAIRKGEIDLTPRPEDGWYQHQLFALQSLLVTDNSEERAKVAFTGRYKRRLQEAFATMLVQHRETHTKQTGGSTTVSAPARPPVPKFRLEPLSTVYVRHARSYVFLETALEAVLGAKVLDTGFAVDESGPLLETLRARIQRARDLFYGMYGVSNQDIGLKPTLTAAGDPSADALPALANAAEHWIRQLPLTELAASDVRVIVPIASISPTRTKYWAVVGVRGTIAGYSYIKGQDMKAPSFDNTARVWLPTEQFLEVVSSSEPPSREEFRKLCDEHSTAQAIKTALEAR